MTKHLVVLLLISACLLQAYELSGESAFYPELRSHLYENLLEETSLELSPLSPADSIQLVPPFTGWHSFLGMLGEAFRRQPAQKAFLRYQHNSPNWNYYGQFSLRAGLDWNSRTNGDYLFMYKGWDFTGNLNNRLYLSSHWWNGQFAGNQDAAAQDELCDSWLGSNGGRISLDNVSGSLSYQDDSILFSLGRSRFNLGDNISGSIILNDQVNDYGYLMAEARLGSFRFSLLNASLKADSVYHNFDNPSLNSKNYPDKYLALHQVSWNISRTLEVFAGETIIYGNRNWDLNYLLPLHFWRASEHNLGDRDNVLIYAGARLRMGSRAFFYSQLALDEFSYGKIFSNWWGNKYALKLGVFSPVFQLPGGESSLALEMTAVRPWTYTHYLNHNMYSTDGRALGYTKGANLLDLTAQLCLPLLPYLELNSSCSYTKQGDFGSDWRQNYLDTFPWTESESATAEWFQGTARNRWTWHSSLKLRALAHHDLLLNLKIEDKTSYSLAWQIRY